MRLRTILRHIIEIAPVIILAILLLGGSSISPGDKTERVRAFTRDIEFNYVSWTVDALRVKLDQISLGTSNYLSEEADRQVVLDYLDLVTRIQQAEAQLREVYGNPEIEDKQAASDILRQDLDKLFVQKEKLAPLAESVLQNQVNHVAADMGLTVGGQLIPPILYHSTPLPYALIVSPRDAIRQDMNISLDPDLTIDQQVALEEEVDQSLDVSSLVVGIGGIGTYPTMVSQTNNLPWLVEVISHEWTHNYLSLRPLGINYLTSPELRTMNETAASISGKEIGRAVLERYYPEFVPPAPPPPTQNTDKEAPEPEPPAFDFRAEMRETRVKVDELLAEGKIEEAEGYMEQRREFFWDNGYHIRKLNQAYFAFYGAYADVPGGAAGEDPVGAAVRQLRAESPSLAAFLNRISWMSSFDQLKRVVESESS